MSRTFMVTSRVQPAGFRRRTNVILCVLNDFFFSTRKASVQNFADDNTLSSFAKSVTLLVEILINESQNAIRWFSENKMIVDPDKSKSITIQNNQTSKPN